MRTLLYVLRADLGDRRDRARLAGRDRRTSRTYLTAHTITGLDADRSRWARSPRRRRSRCSAPTAAASSTPTRRTRSRTRRSSRTSSRCCSVLIIPAALVFIYGRMTGNRRQGYAIYATMMVMFLGAVRRRLHRRGARLAGPARGGPSHRASSPARAAATWKARSSASASPARRSSTSSRRSPRAARSTARSSRSPASAAPSRSRTSRPAR